MHSLKAVLWGAAVCVAPFAWAETGAHPSEAARAADVVFLGEQHDNPGHHAVQAAWVQTLQPKALVFEMLTAEQADRPLDPYRDDPEKLADVLGWADAGWPDFAMYYPIFAAAPAAAIYGAGIPSDRVRGLMTQELSQVAGDMTARFALDQPLPPAEQADREALQKAAHCDALPDQMLPMMVNVQRLRDAALADAALTALQDTGGPVVVITGNGHAREDWGAPFLLRQTNADIAVFALGQGEAGQAPQGGFDTVLDGPVVDRGDPCDAFK